jgi:hypothetical protein
MWREWSLDNNYISFLGMDFAENVFGKKLFTTFQDNGPTVATIGRRFSSYFSFRYGLCGKCFSANKGSSTDWMISGNETWWRNLVILFKRYRMDL